PARRTATAPTSARCMLRRKTAYESLTQLDFRRVLFRSTASGEFLVHVRVEVDSERGIIATLATRVTEQGASIEHINVQERDAHNSVIHLCIGVHNRIHLANIMRRIRNLSFVIRVNRAKN